MNILYVSSIYPGMSNMCNGEIINHSMPGFSKVYNKMIHDGHSIDLVIALPLEDKKNLCLSEISGRVSLVTWSNRYYIDGISSFIKLLLCVYKITSSKKYDLLYGHGPIGVLGNIIARFKGIRFGHRVYGSASLYSDLKINKFGVFTAFLKHPLQFLSFFLKKDFMIVTNDGSKSNKVHKIIGLNSYSFFHWRNGVDFNNSEKKHDFSEEYGRFLLYPARFLQVKNQDIAIDMVFNFNKTYDHSINLVLIGDVSDRAYFDEIKQKVKDLNLSENVFILPSVPASELFDFYKSSFAVLSLNRFSNFGNISIEALTAGCVLISFNDGSLDQVITHNESGMLINNMEHGVDILNSLYIDVKFRKNIQKAAESSAKLNFLSWNDRVDKEVFLIEKPLSK
jgi:glycosyltransferase involved in cell wall biosynthesis